MSTLKQRHFFCILIKWQYQTAYLIGCSKGNFYGYNKLKAFLWQVSFFLHYWATGNQFVLRMVLFMFGLVKLYFQRYSHYVLYIHATRWHICTILQWILHEASTTKFLLVYIYIYREILKQKLCDVYIHGFDLWIFLIYGSFEDIFFIPRANLIIYLHWFR